MQDATVGQRAAKRPRSVPSTWRTIAAENSLDVNESQAFNRMHLPAHFKRGVRYHRSNPYSKLRGHRCPLCSRTFWSSTHARLACQHEAVRGMRTVAHNVAVARIADAIQASNRYHDFRMLVNAGKHHGYKCEWTIPKGLLPGRPGRRGIADTPDIVLIRGWTPGTPLPADKSTVELLLIEVKYTGDKNLKKRRAEAGDTYVSLIQRLHDSGYTVIGEGPSGLPATTIADDNDLEISAQRPAAAPTIFTLVIGVRDTYTTQFLDTLTTLGIRTTNLSRLLRQLHRHTISSLISSVRTHARLCHAKSGIG